VTGLYKPEQKESKDIGSAALYSGASVFFAMKNRQERRIV
jgi:hypothetical protein